MGPLLFAFLFLTGPDNDSGNPYGEHNFRTPMKKEEKELDDLIMKILGILIISCLMLVLWSWTRGVTNLS